MHLDRYNNPDFQRGRSWLIEALWRTVEGIFFHSWIPGSVWRVNLLRLFGSNIGHNVVIKPYVRVKFPWKLTVGDFSWIGEEVWIDNLAEVTVGKHCCLSQGANLCTGSHRWDRDTFDLVTRPIHIEDHCWIGAKTQISPGVTCREGSVLTLGSTASSDLEKWHIYTGSPAQSVKQRPKIEF